MTQHRSTHDLILVTQCRSTHDLILMTQHRSTHDLILVTQCRSTHNLIVMTQCRSTHDLILMTQCRSTHNLILMTQCRSTHNLIVMTQCSSTHNLIVMTQCRLEMEQHTIIINLFRKIQTLIQIMILSCQHYPRRQTKINFKYFFMNKKLYPNSHTVRTYLQQDKYIGEKVNQCLAKYFKYLSIYATCCLM